MSQQDALELRVRYMTWDDIPQILGIAKHSLPPAWIKSDFVSVFQSHETIGYVVEAYKRIIGFVICTVERASRLPHGGTLQPLRDFFRWLIDARTSEPWHIHLLAMGVASKWPRSEIERALLEKLDEEFRRPGDFIQVPVPEVNLSAQKLLRNAGFRAISVLREYFGTEGAYLMERKWGEDSSSAKRVEPRLSQRSHERAGGEPVRTRDKRDSVRLFQRVWLFFETF